MAASAEALEEVLGRSRRLGFLGPGEIEPHIAHAERFAEAFAERPVGTPRSVVDLGAGGGLPSLPLAVADHDLRFVLVDSSAKRTAFLVWATVELGLAERVEVWCGRAEVFGHDSARRGRYDVVVARSFGPPATTLECSAPLLALGGRCVVSEPPGGRRWPADGLVAIGLEQRRGPDGLAVFERTAEIDAAYPRTARELKRRPLFEI